MLLGRWLRLIAVVDGWVMFVRAAGCLTACIWSRCGDDLVECGGGDWIIASIAWLIAWLVANRWDCFILVCW